LIFDEGRPETRATIHAQNTERKKKRRMSIPEILFKYIAGLKGLDVNQIAGTVADDLRVVTPATIVNKEQFLAFLHALYTAFPDWHYDHDGPELRGEEIAVRWRQSGTHTGTFTLPGVTAVASGKKVTIPEQFFYYRVHDNRIVQIRPDPIAGGAPQGILEQIGVGWPWPAA
jgi:predicted ester cyclase